MSPELLFAEISNGFSRGEVITAPDKSLVFYYRHPRHTELFQLEKLTEKSTKEAIEMGLFTFDEALSFIIKEGWWTQEQESELESQEKYLKRLNDTLKVLQKDNERNEIREQILPVQEKITQLLLKRGEYMPETAENFANKKTNQLHITKFLYKDENLTIPLFNENDEDFYSLEPKTSYLLQLEYFNILELFNNDYIQKLASSVMFQNFLYVGGETTNDFFGIPVIKVSRYQFELFISGQNYKNIIKNCQTIDDELPEEFYGNPKSINDHYEKAKRKWESKNKTTKSSSNGRSTVVGGSQVEAQKLFAGKR